MAVLDIREIKENTKCWGFAYSTNNTEKSMSTRCKPVLGMIVVDTSDYYYNTSNSHRYYSFHELKKNGEIKSTSVRATSREYADCKEDAIVRYNELVEYQVQFLLGLVDKTLDDKIEEEN